MNPVVPPRAWFWPSEVAVILQISRATVYNWIDCGKLQTILNSAPYKVPRHEVERLMNPHLLSR